VREVHSCIIAFRDTFPGRASEWALGLMLFNWSVVLTANPDLFAERPACDAFAAIMEQSAWALLCLTVGGTRLIVLAINGAWRRSPHLRALCAFASCFFWFQITVGLAQSDSLGTGMAIYPVLILLDAFNAIRTMGEAGLSDAIHKRVARNGTDT